MVNKMRNFKRFFIWILPVAAAAAIFFFSAQPGDDSAQLSSGFIQSILKAFSGITGIESADMEKMLAILSAPVRKGAHVTEYIVLYLSLILAMYVSGLRGYRRIGLAMMITFLYACTDEFHQVFVPGRAGRFTDVMIDCTGALIICIFIIFRKKRRDAQAGG